MPTAGEDLVDQLLAQHQQIKVLFAQVDTADGDHKQQLFEELVELLTAHEATEQASVHPLAADKLSDGTAVVDARLAEEEDAEQALARLTELGVNHPDFGEELAALRDAVTAHAEAEEELEFPRLREAVDPAQLKVTP